MHLLVLGAFWQMKEPEMTNVAESLNAPSGAGCFLAPCLWEWRRCAISRGWSATGSASTPRDRAAVPLFNHLSAS